MNHRVLIPLHTTAPITTQRLTCMEMWAARMRHKEPLTRLVSPMGYPAPLGIPTLNPTPVLRMGRPALRLESQVGIMECLDNLPAILQDPPTREPVATKAINCPFPVGMEEALVRVTFLSASKILSNMTRTDYDYCYNKTPM